MGVMWVRMRCECDRKKCECEDGTCDWESACEKGVRCVVWWYVMRGVMRWLVEGRECEVRRVGVAERRVGHGRVVFVVLLLLVIGSVCM